MVQKGYYHGLLGSFLACILVLVGYYFKVTESNSSSEVLEAQYHYQTVDGPIQPLPVLIEANQEWVQLGKALFNSKLLSKDNSISCASCHMLDFGGDDGLPVSLGIENQLGDRNAPTVLNAVFNFRQFWDGRSLDLIEQATGPIHNPKEMASHWDQVIEKLENASEFKQAFEALSPDGVTSSNIVQAITRFEETLITPNAPIDKYLLGDSNALTAQQKRGLEKFVNFGCSSCHQGRNIGGNLYQKLGRIDFVPEELLDDLGRYNITHDEADKHVFKVPSLRNIAETAPYFHTGSITSLEDAVNIMAKAQLGMDLSQDDIDDIVALLKSFSGSKINESYAKVN